MCRAVLYDSDREIAAGQQFWPSRRRDFLIRHSKIRRVDELANIDRQHDELKVSSSQDYGDRSVSRSMKVGQDTSR